MHTLTLPLPRQAAGNLDAFPTFYDPLEPESRRPPHDVRVRRFAHRLKSVVSSPHVLATKAVLASPSASSGPDDDYDDDKPGSLVAIALWHRPGAPVRNTKRRNLLGDAPEGETKEDREAWEHVDLEAWEKVWREWDEVRESVMGDTPHWCALLLLFLRRFGATTDERVSDAPSPPCLQTSSPSGSSPRTKASASARPSCSK